MIADAHRRRVRWLFIVGVVWCVLFAVFVGASLATGGDDSVEKMIEAHAAGDPTRRPPVGPVPSDLSPEWHLGGTLHNASAGEWNGGSYRDQLATASDWVLKFWSATTDGPLGSGDDFYLYSSWLQRCVYEMSDPSPVDEPAANIAVVCWVGKWGKGKGVSDR